MEQQEVKDDVITPESNPIAYTLSVTTPDEVVAVVNNPEIKPHARPTYELTRNVFFVGFMVAGKTSTSRRLARQCGLATIDLDAYIERRERRAINQIFAEQGEQAFRDMETQVLDEFAHKGPMLVSCGGGIVLREENREILKNNGFVVYLQVTAEQAVERVGDVSTRPLFKNSRPRDRPSPAACLCTKTLPACPSTPWASPSTSWRRRSRRFWRRKACCACDKSSGEHPRRRRVQRAHRGRGA